MHVCFLKNVCLWINPWNTVEGQLLSENVSGLLRSTGCIVATFVHHYLWVFLRTKSVHYSIGNANQGHPNQYTGLIHLDKTAINSVVWFFLKSGKNIFVNNLYENISTFCVICSGKMLPWFWHLSIQCRYLWACFSFTTSCIHKLLVLGIMMIDIS